ncbi:uncharacterized protein cracdla [Stigmatopora argus]
MCATEARLVRERRAVWTLLSRSDTPRLRGDSQALVAEPLSKTAKTGPVCHTDTEMEAFSVDSQEGAKDPSGWRKSRIRSLRTRQLARSKPPAGDFGAMFSKSVGDIQAGRAPGSRQDLPCPPGTLGSRALSHDSIFWAQLVQTEDDGALGAPSSPENLHGKIKALQVKLERQKMHLGPPPLVPTIRRPNDEGERSEEEEEEEEEEKEEEEDILWPPPRSPAAASSPSHGALSQARSRVSPHPFSPLFKAPASKSVAFAGTKATPSPTFSPSVPSVSATDDPPLDFGSPARFTPSLDTSAARHRLAVKPRNKRASTKRRATRPDAVTEDTNNDPEPPYQALVTEKQDGFQKTSQPQAIPPRAPLNQPLASRLSPVSSEELQAKLQKRAVVASPFPENTLAESDLRASPLDKSPLHSFHRPSAGVASPESSPVRLRDVAPADSPRGVKRPGSRSFHRTDASCRGGEDGPRSGGFAEAAKPARSGRGETAGPRDERGDPQPAERDFAFGKLGPERRSSVLLRERKDADKNVQWPKSVELVPDSGRETMAEVGEDRGKTVLAFKASSVPYWSAEESCGRPSRMLSKKQQEQEQGDGLKRPESWEMFSKNANDAGDLAVADPAPQHHASPPSLCKAREVQSTLLNPPGEPRPSPEVSWVSLAVEKTRSLQQLFARRFPKDRPGPASPTPTETACDEDRGVTEQRPPGGSATPPTTGSPFRSVDAAPQDLQTRSPLRSQTGLQAGLQPATWRLKTGPALVDHQAKETANEKESFSPPAERSFKAGSVGEKAALLEKQAQRWPPLGAKAESRKAQPESETPSQALVEKRDIRPQDRDTWNPAESSSPIRIRDGPLQEKWTRQKRGSSPSPSSSPIMRSTPDSAQPSWMELAKRKSMAWSDKTMD